MCSRLSRGSLEDLSTRVNQLEATVFNYTSSNISDTPILEGSNHDITNTRPADLQVEVQVSTSPVTSNAVSVTKSYRGATSSWSVLVNHLRAFDDPELTMFGHDAARFADYERSSTNSSKIPYDLLRKFPELTQEDIFIYISAYALDAPYPILHYKTLLETTESLLNMRGSTHWGQIVCVLMVCLIPPTSTRSPR